MIRRILIGTAAIGGIALAAAVANGAHHPLLRSISLFQVVDVEVSGAWLMAPHEAFEALDLGPGAHLWDDHEPALARIRLHPAVLDVRARRQLPGTLVLEVEERMPVALLADDGLVPLTADGSRVPIDPARLALDLPLVRADSEGVDPLIGALVAVAEMGIEVSEIQAAPDGHRLILVEGFEVRLKDHDRWSLAQLLSVVESLRRGEAYADLDPSRIEIDMRFGGQAVVRPADPERDRERAVPGAVIVEGSTHTEGRVDA